MQTTSHTTHTLPKIVENFIKEWAWNTERSDFYGMLLYYISHEVILKHLQSVVCIFSALLLSIDSLSILHLIQGKICFWSNMHSHALWQARNQMRKIINLVLNVLKEWYMLYLPIREAHIWIARCQQTVPVTFLTPD